jgi:putative glutamine amidotransferase
MTPSADPVVLVAADVKEIDGHPWHAVVQTYLDALIHGSGAIPLIVPALGAEVDHDALLARVDGVLLPGSRSNVHPSHYGDAESEAARPHDPGRDNVTLPLVRAALRHGVPLFAICRGMQEMNVALGGSLHPELHAVPGRGDHRAPPSGDRNARFAIRQDVHVARGGLLERIVGPGVIRVNSLHRQGVNRLAEPLAVEATAPDGTVEAVRVKDAAAFALGVQWHPEYWVRTDRVSQLLFSAYGEALRARHGALAAAQ